MALFVPGMKCRICGVPMTNSDELIGFPHFVSDRGSDLWFFSDGVFHRHCFKKHKLATEVEEFAAQAIKNNKPANRICAICSEVITEPDDYIGSGLLTNLKSNPLYEFNFMHYHLSHIPSWSRLEEFLARLRKFILELKPDAKKPFEDLLREFNSAKNQNA